MTTFVFMILPTPFIGRSRPGKPTKKTEGWKMTDNKTNVELLHCYLRKQHKANGVDLIEDSLFIKLGLVIFDWIRHFSSVLMLAYIIGNSQGACNCFYF